MKILPDGTLYLDAGETIPYQCPICKTYIAFKEADRMTCDTCGYSSDSESFSDVRFTLTKPN